jgi:hypothetical protein
MQCQCVAPLTSVRSCSGAEHQHISAGAARLFRGQSVSRPIHQCCVWGAATFLSVRWHRQTQSQPQLKFGYARPSLLLSSATSTLTDCVLFVSLCSEAFVVCQGYSAPPNFVPDLSRRIPLHSDSMLSPTLLLPPASTSSATSSAAAAPSAPSAPTAAPTASVASATCATAAVGTSPSSSSSTLGSSAAAPPVRCTPTLSIPKVTFVATFDSLTASSPTPSASAATGPPTPAAADAPSGGAVPFVCCHSATHRYDSDQSYPLQNQPYRAPLAPPLVTPYSHSLQLKRQTHTKQ